MIFGYFDYDDVSVHARGDTYRIEGISVYSVRRPFLPLGAMIAAGIGGFWAANYDLLWPLEQLLICIVCIGAMTTGWKLGQLQFLSRDLKGSELMGVIYGTYDHLNRVRRDIAASKRGHKLEDQT